MKLTQTEFDITTLPENLRKYLRDSELFDSSSHSDAKVIYSTNGYFLKTASNGSLKREAENIKLFFRSNLGVELCEYISEDMDYMITKEASGRDLTHHTNNPANVCEIMWRAIKKLHETPTDGFGKSEAVKYYEIFSPDGKEAKITDVTKFFGINTTQDVYNIIKSRKDPLKTDTLIHGDHCLPNLITDDCGNITYIDTGLSGKGDINIDLYWSVWSIWYNLKDMKWAEYFLSLYGEENYDYDTLRYISAIEAIS